MSADKEQSPAPITVFSYNVRTTHVITGLPHAHEQQVLRQYRSLFHHTEQRDHPAPSAEYAPGTQYGDLNTTYDITCQYLRNLHTMETRGTHTDSDDNSIFSIDPEMPPLEPVASSSPSSPQPMEVVASAVDKNSSPEPVEAVASAVDKNDSMPSLEPALPSRASSPSAPEAVADDDSAPDPALPTVPAWHLWSSQEAWRRCWDRLNQFHAVFGEREPERAPELTEDWMAFPNPSPSRLFDGEGVERMWAEGSPLGSSTRQMGEGYRRTTLYGTGDVHNLRIVSIHGVREVKCDCTDGLHTIYEHKHAFAFCGRDGDLIIKKGKTSLLMNDTAIDYEVRRGETSQDIGFHVSTDGRRAVRQGINVGVKKRRVAPSDLVDTYGDWMPLHGDADDMRAGLDDNEGQEDPSTSGEKRKRYESSEVCPTLEMRPGGGSRLTTALGRTQLEFLTRSQSLTVPD
ncbi:hypothetical protein DFH06DRAFT_1125228 [Mycena polygramma]|nr:hypothetical protein DFH06DRAFT_1125228 [Mycena polygramma]